MNDRIDRFVREALASGHDRARIGVALTDAGWTHAEADRALAAYAEGGFVPPVPRPVPVLSARDFFREALRFVALAVVAVNLVDLGHGIVDRTIGTMPPIPFGGDIWWPVASMVVFGPIYAVLAWRHRAGGADAGRSLVRRWTASVILLATTLILLGSLVAVLNRFLIGGADAVFLAKAAIVAAVAGAILVAHRQR